MLCWHFCQPPASWLICKGNFSIRQFGVRETVGAQGRAYSIDHLLVPISSPLTQYGLSLTIFELFNWLQKRFRPSTRSTQYNGKYHSIRHRVVERQKAKSPFHASQHDTPYTSSCAYVGPILKGDNSLLSACTTYVFIWRLVHWLHCYCFHDWQNTHVNCLTTSLLDHFVMASKTPIIHKQNVLL